MATAPPKSVFNDTDDYIPNSVDPHIVEQYAELSDERTTYETAFGTTIVENDYMNQYVKYNRENSKLKINITPITKRKSDALLSLPTPNDNILKEDHCIIAHHKNNDMHHLNIAKSPTDTLGDLPTNLFPPIPSPSPQGINIDTSESLGTRAAMTQASKYYNELLNNHRKSGCFSAKSTPISSRPVSATAKRINEPSHHTLNTFKILSYSRVMENFENKRLEYGQNVVYDKVNDQYFSDLETSNKRYVLINLHVNRITEIDTVRERFRCQFWISFSWLPTYYEWLDFKDHQINNNLCDWKPAWIPIITFPELIHQWKLHFAERPNLGKFHMSLLHGNQDEIGYDPKCCKFIRCKLECDLTFSTGFLLVNFPLDCQDLPISIHETSGGCIFVAEKRKRSFASIHTISSVMEEWEFLNMMIEIGGLIVGTDNSSLAQIKVRLKMQRRFEVYLWNVVFFMASISGLTLSSFGVDSVDLGERLAIIITLLLTSVAYQSNVFSILPNVPYLTLLDKYIVTSFVFMTMVTVETALLGSSYLDHDEHNVILFMITLIVFVGYHSVFLMLAIKRKEYEQRKLYMSSKMMQQLYLRSRERMDVDWKSVKQLGSNWKIYTKYPDKLITKTNIGPRDLYRFSSRRKDSIF